MILWSQITPAVMAHWGPGQGAGSGGVPGVVEHSLTGRTHPNLTRQWGTPGGSPSTSSRHSAPLWGQEWAETRLGCQPLSGCGSAESSSLGLEVNLGHGHLTASQTVSRGRSGEGLAVSSTNSELPPSPRSQRSLHPWDKGGLSVHPGLVLEQIIKLFFHFPSI